MTWPKPRTMVYNAIQNSKKNRTPLAIQIFGLFIHSLFTGWCMHILYAYSLATSTTGRFGMGLLGVLPTLVLSYETIGKGWLALCFTWYAGESILIAVFAKAIVQATTHRTREGCVVAFISAAISLAMAGIACIYKPSTISQ